jgi:5'-3' exonuclease
MGIPSYFSQIIRKYAKILRNINQINDNKEDMLTHLYMDCNSIIYDSYHHISNEYDKNNESDFEKKLIHETARRIEKYIKYIKPTEVVYVSFDGVAPLAKMVQQRRRRYITKFMANVKYEEDKDVPIVWDTSNITPGTDFMKKLSNYMYYYFGLSEMKYNVKQVIVSCSDKQGEGEHKLFSHIRNNDLLHANVAVYGLDADLIMLSIFHLKQCRRIYVCREAPEFLKSSIPVDVNIGDDESYFVDINCLGECILNELGCEEGPDPTKSRLNDYVFLCFLLGNDFLPHHVSLDIRKNGMDILINAYKRSVLCGGVWLLCSVLGVNWCSVRVLMLELCGECSVVLSNTKSNKNVRVVELLNVPCVYGVVERYIGMSSCGWESRYYKMLFARDVSLCEISVNYLEGLEWVYKYYTGDCVDWRWRYRYNYAPLLVDCKKWLPKEYKELCMEKSEALSEKEALKYVMPPENVSGPFEWAFCRYFWECHPLYE